MSQQFRVKDGASVMIKSTFFRGPCLLPAQAAEWLSKNMAGRSGKTSMEDAIANGFIEPVGSVTHLDADLLNPGVRNSEIPPLKMDADNGKPTPDSLTVTTSEGGVKSGMSTGATGPDVVSQGESFGPASEPAEAVPSSDEWNFSDEQLAGKSLDDLNLLIIERLPMDQRPEFVHYEDENEARAHLQGDIE